MASSSTFKWGVVTLVGVVLIAAALALLHQRRVHREQAAAAQARFKKVDATYSVVQKIQVRFLRDYQKMEADYAIASKAGKKRHDDDSLSFADDITLAHTERTKVEAAQALQRDFEAADEVFLESLTSLYGADAVAKLRQDMANRNEARDNFLDMWWRAAQSIEDNAKDEQNGNESANSTDEIVRDYDESAKEQNHAEQLQLDVDRESNAIQHRLSLDWQNAKRSLVLLGGI